MDQRRTAGQAPGLADQTAQPTAEGRVEPLDVGRVQPAPPLGGLHPPRQPTGGPLQEPWDPLDAPPLLLPFHDLADHSVAPRHEPGTAPLTGPFRRAEGAP